MYVFSSMPLAVQMKSKADVTETGNTEVLGYRDAPLARGSETSDLSDVFVFGGTTREPGSVDDNLLLDPVFEDALASAMSARFGTQAVTVGAELPVLPDTPEPDSSEYWDRAHHDAMMSPLQNLMEG